MTHIRLSDAAYEVTLGPAAIRVVLSLANPARITLAHALLTELSDGPNAGKEVRFDSDVGGYADPGDDAADRSYTATPLSFAGYTAIHRLMTEAEITRLRAERAEEGRPVGDRGFYVFDILAAESAFIRTVPRLV
jgi:hypothetical protein